MAVLIAALLAVLVIAVVLYPFVKSRFSGQTTPARDSLPEVRSGSREAVYEEIKTLRLEYELGSIEESEYQERLQEYRLLAATALRDEERPDVSLSDTQEQNVDRHEGPPQ